MISDSYVRRVRVDRARAAVRAALALGDGPPRTCADLSALTGLPWHAVARHLYLLERDELVYRCCPLASGPRGGMGPPRWALVRRLPDGVVSGDMTVQHVTEAPESALTRMLAEFHAALADERGRGNAMLRVALHEEEHSELIEALEGTYRNGWAVDRLALARELADVVLVAFGTAHAFAIDLDVAVAEVHRSLMSKVDGPGLPLLRDDGKVLKPPGFVPPDMSGATG